MVAAYVDPVTLASHFCVMQAKKRNPNITIVGLPWSFPYWYTSLMDPKGVAYYVSWVGGMPVHSGYKSKWAKIWI